MKRIDANDLVSKTVDLPLVHIDRSKFLSEQFASLCSSEEMSNILKLGPIAAEVSPQMVDKLAKDCIVYETTKVTALSFAAGIPGGFAMLGTIPADMAQYYAHVFRIAQKLAYLYGFPDIAQMGDGTNSLYILFLGIMSGVQAATVGIKAVFAPSAAAVSKRLAAKPLTKGIVYPIVKTVAIKLGHEMTKEIFAKGVGKIVPIAGGVMSAAITFPSYKIMANRLHTHLIALNKISIIGK